MRLIPDPSSHFGHIAGKCSIIQQFNMVHGRWGQGVTVLSLSLVSGGGGGGGWFWLTLSFKGESGTPQRFPRSFRRVLVWMWGSHWLTHVTILLFKNFILQFVDLAELKLSEANGIHNFFPSQIKFAEDTEFCIFSASADNMMRNSAYTGKIMRKNHMTTIVIEHCQPSWTIMHQFIKMYSWVPFSMAKIQNYPLKYLFLFFWGFFSFSLFLFLIC